MIATYETIFFDVDTQIDFLYPAGALYVPGAEQIVGNVARLNRFAAAQRLPADLGYGRPQRERSGVSRLAGALRSWNGGTNETASHAAGPASGCILQSRLSTSGPLAHSKYCSRSRASTRSAIRDCLDSSNRSGRSDL